MLFVPAGTPEDRVEILTRGMQEAMASEAVAQYLERAGSRKLDVYGDEAEQFVGDQVELWRSVIEAAGIEPQE